MVSTPATVVGVNYRAALGGVNNGNQFLDIIYPTAVAMPVTGWPWVLWVLDTGFAGSTRAGFVSEVQGAFFLARERLIAGGIAIVDVAVTVDSLAPGSGSPGAVGGGWYRDPATDAQWKLDGTGDDLLETDVIAAWQWTVYNAAANNLDPLRGATAGVSAGSVGASYLAGAEHADPSSPILQRRVSTRPRALGYLRPPGYFRGFCLDSALSGLQNHYFRKQANPALLAVDGLDGNLTHGLHASPQHFMFQTGGALELNATLPVYIATEGIVGDGDLGVLNPAIDPVTFAPLYLGTAIKGLVQEHDAFHGAALVKQLRAYAPTFHGVHTRVVAKDDWAAHGAGLDPDQIIPTYEAIANDFVAWLLEEMPFVEPPVPQPTPRHFFFEEAGNGVAPWDDTFGDEDLQPHCSAVLDGDAPEDRVVVMGCRDGQVRTWSRQNNSDDGVAIESTVLLGPMAPDDLAYQLQASGARAVLAGDQDGVLFEWIGGESPDSIGPVMGQGAFEPGANGWDLSRAVASYLWIRLHDASVRSWGLENLLLRLGLGPAKR